MCIDSVNDPRVGKFGISESESGLLIGKICLTYLTLDTFAETPLPVNLYKNIHSDVVEDTNAVCADSEESKKGGGSDQGSHDNGRRSALQWEEITGKEENVNNKDVSSGGESEEEETQILLYKRDTPAMLFLPHLDTYPLLLYAAARWCEHCQSHLTDPMITTLLHQLFHPRKSKQFLWWSFASLCDIQGDHWNETFPDTTTLHWAALLELEEVCRWLIRDGSDVNRGSSLGTPLDCLLLGVESILVWQHGLEDIRYHSYWNNEVKATRGSIAHLFVEAGLELNDNSSSTSSWLPLQLTLETDSHNKYLVALLL